MSGNDCEITRRTAGILLAVQAADPDRVKAAFAVLEINPEEVKKGTFVLTTRQIQTICREVSLSYEGLMEDVQSVIEHGGITH